MEVRVTRYAETSFLIPLPTRHLTERASAVEMAGNSRKRQNIKESSCLRQNVFASGVHKVAIALLSISSVPAARADVFCQGTLATMHVMTDGTLLINPSWRSDYIRICSLSVLHADDGLRIVAAIAKEAIRSAKNVAAYYFDSSGTLTCAGLPSNTAAPTPHFSC